MLPLDLLSKTYTTINIRDVTPCMLYWISPQLMRECKSPSLPNTKNNDLKSLGTFYI